MVTKSEILNNRDSQFYFQMYPFPILINRIVKYPKREYNEKTVNTVINHVQTNQYRSINNHNIIKHHINAGLWMSRPFLAQMSLIDGLRFWKRSLQTSMWGNDSGNS